MRKVKYVGRIEEDTDKLYTPQSTDASSLLTTKKKAQIGGNLYFSKLKEKKIFSTFLLFTF